MSQKTKQKRKLANFRVIQFDMICPFCQHASDQRSNTYGTVCPKCENVVSPVVKSSLKKYIEARKQQDIDLVRGLLKKKLGGTHAHRN